VVPRFEMRGDQEDELGVRVIGTRPIVGLPDGVAETRPRRADVRVTVVPVDAPRLQHALDVAFMSGPADVVDDLVTPSFLQSLADACRDQLDSLLPADRLPLAFAARADAPQRMEDTIRVIDLVDGRRPLGTEPAATRGMDGIALELADRVRLLVDV